MMLSRPFSVTSLSVLAGVAVGLTVFVSWATWKYMRRKFRLVKQPYRADMDIYIVNTSEEWEAACVKLMKDLTTVKVLGLDCEWVQRKKVALLQLASPSGLCVLVRLFKLRPTFPESLRLLLQDKSILKVGVAVIDDAKKLHQEYGLGVCGCVDLRHMLRRIRGVFHCRSRGLKGLAKGILGVDISKDVAVRCGNWEADTYTQQQIDYAAADAAVAVDIFIQLALAKMELSAWRESPLVPIRNASEQAKTTSSSDISLETAESDRLAYANGKDTDMASVDKSFPLPQRPSDRIRQKDKNPVADADSVRVDSSGDETIDDPHVEKEENDTATVISDKDKSKDQGEAVSHAYKSVQGRKFQDLRMEEKENLWKVARSLCQGIVDSGYVYQAKSGGLPTPPKQPDKDKTTNAYATRKRPLWDNCRLEAPDGNVLCTCDIRKAQWYLDKELGDKVCDDPLTVRLRFEPASRPESERNYYLQEKENICVVCGYDRDYVRKFVIPFEYRKYFPNALKDHSSHDVLLLCTPCHRRSCDCDSQLRLQLAVECNAPVESGATAKTMVDHELQKIRSAGRALKLSRHSIPEQRVLDLQNLLRDFYGVDDITDELIDQASTVDARQTADDYVPHGKLVVRHMAQNGGLLAFQSRWRQHFLDTMNPQFLPAFWSVDFIPEAWNQRHSV